MEELLYWIFVKSIVFAVSIKLCDESGLAILSKTLKNFLLVLLLCYQIHDKIEIHA